MSKENVLMHIIQMLDLQSKTCAKITNFKDLENFVAVTFANIMGICQGALTMEVKQENKEESKVINKYFLDLDDLMDALYIELEKVQDGNRSHSIMIREENKREAAVRLTQKLVPFFEKNFYEAQEE
jgi:hypothetical protein